MRGTKLTEQKKNNFLSLKGRLPCSNDGLGGGLLESDGLVDNVVSAVDDLLDDPLDGNVDISSVLV